MTVEQATDHLLNPPTAKRPPSMNEIGQIVLSNGMRLAWPAKSTHKTSAQRKLEKSRRRNK